MPFDQTLAHRYREFFHFVAPGAAVSRAVGSSPAPAAPDQIMVFNIHSNEGGVDELEVEGRTAPVIPFPLAAKGLAAIALDDRQYAGDGGVNVLLPRSAFDSVADQNGAGRISSLSLGLGAGQGDVVLAHLSAGLEHALSTSAPDNAMINQISLTMTLHMAQRYGAMQPPRSQERGALTLWQLRLARNTFDRNLDGSVSLEGLAASCGLSSSHFSRAFSRSTGLAPHRWLIQRRIEVAKDMILRRSSSLAQIALDCGFSDQSHFTRAFASSTGLTPGRWRIAQSRGDPGADSTDGAPA